MQRLGITSPFIIRDPSDRTKYIIKDLKLLESLPRRDLKGKQCGIVVFVGFRY